jgi:reductive dehalogenase
MLKRMQTDPTKLMNINEGVLKGLTFRPPRKVDKPTYEIVGPVERYDMRDYPYIICMGFAQSNFMTDTLDGLAENFEVGWMYSYASYVSIIIANFIRNLGWRARPLPAFNAPYIVPPVFIDAGIGEFGRCGYVVSKEVGPNWRPGAVATDLPLAVDRPVDFGLQDFCENCGICADLCPCGAIPKGPDAKTIVRGVKRWQVDDNKCYRYWCTIGHACGTCQSVCPWSHRTNLFHKSVRELAESFAGLRKLLILGEELTYKHKRGPEPKWMTDDIFETKD